MSNKLFSPFTLGGLTLPNRIAMAPMTRCRAANPAIAPTPMMVEYYGLRADAGLIVSEGAPVSAQARGYAFTPGLYSAEQIAGWQAVTQEVHKQGGRIFASSGTAAASATAACATITPRRWGRARSPPTASRWRSTAPPARRR